MVQQQKFITPITKRTGSVLAASWAALIALMIVFGGSDSGCLSDYPRSVEAALVIGVITISLSSGMFVGLLVKRIFTWPKPPSNRLLLWSQILISVLVGAFVSAVTVFAFGMSQFGC